MTDVSLHEPISTRKKVTIILALAVPAMIENFMQTIVGFVDTLFVAKLGIAAVAAVGLANTIIAVYIAVFMAMGIGASSMIARSLGGGDIERAKKVARESTRLSVILGILFGIISLIFAEPLMRMMGAESYVLTEGVIYLKIVGVPSIFISLMFIFSSILRATGDTKTPMKVAIWINVLHIVLDYILIFGFIGFTGLGVAGAAWATVIVRVVGTIALYVYIKKSKVAFNLLEGWYAYKNEVTKPLLKLSAPAAIERLIMRLGQVLYFGLIVYIGTDVYAAHIIAGNIEVFSYMPGYGLAVAATVLVGQSLGAKRIKDAYEYGMITAGIAVGFMSFIGVLLFFFSPWFATWFTNDTTTIDMVVTALRIDAFAQPALAVGLVLAGALQGAGDTKSPMISTAIGMWVIRVLGVYILGIQMALGIAGIWLSIAVDLFIRALYLYLRFKKALKFNKVNQTIGSK